MWHKLILVFGVFFCPLVMADEVCDKNASAAKYSGMVAGFGEGADYQEAKINAIADAISVFGIAITSQGETMESNESAQWNGSVKSEISALVKGAQVLSDCPQTVKHAIWIGIKKTTIAGLIEHHSNDRVHWAKTALSTLKAEHSQKVRRDLKVAFEKINEEEKNDLDAWMIIGRPVELFTKISDSHKTEISKLLDATPKERKVINIIASDVIAERTISILKQKLSMDGYIVDKKSNESVSWTCNLNRGEQVGRSLRFNATCILNGLSDFEPVVIDSISTADNLENTAIRLIAGKLMAH